MRLFMVLLLLILSSSYCFAADPGPKNGFREMVWGDKLSPDMKNLDSKKAGMDLYYKSGEFRGKVAGIDNVMITYMFYNKKLCGVELDIFSLEYSKVKALSETLTKEWGKPEYNVDHPTELLHQEWISNDGLTMSSVAAMKKVIKESDRSMPENLDNSNDWLVQISIGEKSCAEQAASNLGL